MNRISGALAMSAFVVAAACGSDSVVDSSLGEATVLHVGEVAEFAEAGLRVGFTEVRDDSRCPPPETGAVCVWEGSATVVLWAEKPPEPRSELRLATTTAGGGSTVASYAGYEIELVSLSPPHVGDIPQSEYGARLLVRPAE